MRLKDRDYNWTRLVTGKPVFFTPSSRRRAMRRKFFRKYFAAQGLFLVLFAIAFDFLFVLGYFPSG